MLTSLLLVFAAPNGIMGYLKRNYTGDRAKIFHGLYRSNAFDTALLIPYFIVMVILAFYGIHRYQLVWLYFKNKKNAAKWDEPPARYGEGELPFVTVQLPIFNEQFVIDRLIDAVCRLDYPRDRFEIQVLDDSTDETVTVAREIVERYAAGFAGMEPQPIVYLHRTNRYGYKAGALDEGLKVAQGELVAIFDADFVPPPEWVMQVVHHFAEPEIGMVQTRWTHLNRGLQLYDAGGGDPAGWALCAGAWRAVAGGRVLQLQRHGGDVAAGDDCECGRMAA